jgi:hypothetical protein
MMEAEVVIVALLGKLHLTNLKLRLHEKDRAFLKQTLFRSYYGFCSASSGSALVECYSFGLLP